MRTAITAPAQLITAPAQLITAPAQLITAPAQPPATRVAVYTALLRYKTCLRGTLKREYEQFLLNAN